MHLASALSRSPAEHPIQLVRSCRADALRATCDASQTCTSRMHGPCAWPHPIPPLACTQNCRPKQAWHVFCKLHQQRASSVLTCPAVSQCIQKVSASLHTTDHHASIHTRATPTPLLSSSFPHHAERSRSCGCRCQPAAALLACIVVLCAYPAGIIPRLSPQHQQ